MKKEISNVDRDRKKGMRISLAIHSSILLLALLPFVNNQVEEAEEWTVVEIAFVNSDISSGVSSEAPKEVTPEVVEKMEKDLTPKSIEVAPPSEEIILDDAESEVVVEDNFDEAAEEVVLDNEEVEEEVSDELEEVTEEVIEDSALESDSEEGEGDEGEHITGEELGKMNFDGDGVFGRKVIYRADVKKITEREGSVVINLCVDRKGHVTHVAFNKENSSIHDARYVKKAMEVAADYRFEKDYSAPASQCGKLTFTFHIE